MKILIVGSQRLWALEHIYIKYLKEVGSTIDIFAAPDFFVKNYSKSIFSKIYYRLFPKKILGTINNQLIFKISEFKPDIIWVFKGTEIFPQTLNKIKSKGILLCNYNPDHPFIISSRGGGNQNVRDSVSLYDLHFCYNESVMEKIKNQYKISTVRLPFGYELSDKLYEECKKDEELLKVCFLGNPDKIRTNLIRRIAENNIEVAVYGHGWDKWINFPNVLVNDAVYDDDMWKTLRKYRVQLNIFRPHNLGSHNMRTFEIPAVGGIMLAPNSEEHQMFFQDGKEFFSYTSFDEALEKIKYLLALSTNQANEIRNAARAKSIEKGYSYKQRSATVFNALTQRLELKK